jgi:hypothetical protein
MSRELRDDGRLAPYEVEWLEEIYDWFNQELPCPPFARCNFPIDAVSWFRPKAARFIHRMWDLAALLQEHGRPVRLLKSAAPGDILYHDDHQIVAEPKRWGRRTRRGR